MADVLRRIHEIKLQATLSSFVMLKRKKEKKKCEKHCQTPPQHILFYIFVCSFAALLFEFVYWKQFEMTHLECEKILKIIDLVFVFCKKFFNGGF